MQPVQRNSGYASLTVKGREASTISVCVPTFEDRTVSLRRTLAISNAQLESRTYDKEAQRGATRMTMGRFETLRGILFPYA